MPRPGKDAAGPGTYFERPPEKLVLEGYRHWARGIALRSDKPWTQAQFLYRHHLGSTGGELAVAALDEFARTLNECAASTLSIFEAGSTFISNDETLVMGLVSGLQHGDERSVMFCLDRLCKHESRDQAAMVAGSFALTLKFMQQLMRPVPLQFIERIINHSCDPEVPALPAARSVHTLH